MACNAASRFLNAPVRKDKVEQAVRPMVLARLRARQLVQAVFGVRCTRRASIPPAHLDRVLECRGDLVLAPLVQGLEPRLAWHRQLELEIVHRVGINNGAVETIATKNRRKVR